MKNKSQLVLIPWQWVIASVLLFSMMIFIGIESWKDIVIMIIILFPILCYTLVFAFFYDKYILIIRPLNIFSPKKIVSYDNIVYVKEPNDTRLFLGLSLQVEGMKKAIECPLPLSMKKRKTLYEFLKSKGIRVEDD